MSKIIKQILINLFIAAMAICVIMYLVQFKTENPDKLIENAIKTNMLSNGEIVFHEKYRHGKWRYDYVIMKYKNETFILQLTNIRQTLKTIIISTI